MKVLSIDLDYIMGKSIHLYEDIGWDDNPYIRWQQYFDQKDTKEDLCIDEKNLYYCLDIFLKAIKNSSNVSFAYNHDSILDDIIYCNDIELVNIDHHDDLIYHDHYDSSSNNPMRSIEYMKSLHRSYEKIKNGYEVNEGNWISLLNIKGKLKSYTFIGNEDSVDLGPEKKSFIDKHFPNVKCLTREQYYFSNYNFDYIFVCLSPQFIPPSHWHYFYIFISIYENLTGNIVNFEKMPIRNYSTNYEYSEVTDRFKLV